jgi:hypothetical protein
MILDRISGTATIVSGAAATATAITFDAMNAPSKIVRFLATVPSFADNASAAIYVYQGSTGPFIYGGASQITAGAINTPVDINVFPGDTVQVITTATIEAGPNTMAVSAQLER